MRVSLPSREQLFGKKAKFIAKLAVACLLLCLLLSRVNFELAKELIPQTRLGILLLALALFLARNLIAAWRWQILLASKNCFVPLASLVRFYLIGNFFGFFLPTAIGGDIPRGYYSYKAGVNKEESTSSIIVERTLGIAAMMAFALVAVFFGFGLINNILLKSVVIVPSAFFLIALILFYSSRINDRVQVNPPALERLAIVGRNLNKLRRFIGNIHQYSQSPTALFVAFLCSIVYQLTGIATVYLIALSIGSDLAFMYFLILLPIVWWVSMIPISLNGLGIREGAFVFLFTSVGADKETAAIIAGLFLLMSIVQGTVGSIFFLWDRQKIAAIRQYPHLEGGT